MERLIEEETYREYVRGGVNVSAFQTGFSDAGRFIGQISATLAIERYYHGLAAIIEKAKLEDIETLVFSTHGESMGRGAHPGTLYRRLHYVMTNEAAPPFRNGQNPVKHETSFQGGDGYMFFGNRALTTRALATIVKDGEIPPAETDPFYSEQNFSLDFFLRLRGFQQTLFFARWIPRGSRCLWAQPALQDGIPGPSSVRANPHLPRIAAIPRACERSRTTRSCSRFGYIANVVAGLGTAVGADRKRFNKLVKSSKRLQSLLAMIAHGKTISSLNAMEANSQVFNAGPVGRARLMGPGGSAEQCVPDPCDVPVAGRSSWRHLRARPSSSPRRDRSARDLG